MTHKEWLTQAFPIGVKYGQHRDLQEKYWDHDLKNMQDCGIDALRVHAFWSQVEPREGQFDFAQYDRLVEKAHTYGIRVMFTLYHMASPEWIFTKHPDSRFVTMEGKVWGSNQHTDNSQGGWPGLCFDSMPFRQTIENMVKAFVLHYKGNENVLAIDVWHEPCYEAGEDTCYCEHSIQHFKEWLEKKYGSLEGLNRAWTRYYSSWDEVDAPRHLGQYTDWLDWKLYRIDMLSDAVHWMGSLVKKYDPDRASSVHTGIIEMGHPCSHADNRFKLADATDMFGISLYESSKLDISAYAADLMRSACKGSYWVGETGTGSGPIFYLLGLRPDEYHCFSKNIDASEIFRLSWSQLAWGAKGIFYWAWRPDISTLEHLSLGFTERNGDLTERTEGLKQFTTVFRKYRSNFANTRSQKSDLCILYNMDSQLIEGIISSGFEPAGGKNYKDFSSFVGLERLLMKNGMTPEYISKEELEEGILSEYQYLFLPYNVSVCTGSAEKIREFVYNGGTVISDAMLGFFTDGAWGSEVCPPQGLDEVFGLSTSSSYDLITYDDIVMDGRVYREVGKNVKERLMLHEGTEVKAAFSNGRPAIAVNHYGKGKTIYIATMMFATVLNKGLKEIDPLFNEILKLADYRKDKTIAGVDEDIVVDVRRQIGDGEEFVFLINQSEEEIHPSVKVELSLNGAVTEIRTGEVQQGTEGKLFRWSGIIEPQGVRVFHIEKM